MVQKASESKKVSQFILREMHMKGIINKTFIMFIDIIAAKFYTLFIALIYFPNKSPTLNNVNINSDPHFPLSGPYIDAFINSC